MTTTEKTEKSDLLDPDGSGKQPSKSSKPSKSATPGSESNKSPLGRELRLVIEQAARNIARMRADLERATTHLEAIAACEPSAVPGHLRELSRAIGGTQAAAKETDREASRLARELTTQTGD